MNSEFSGDKETWSDREGGGRKALSLGGRRKVNKKT